MTTTDDQKPPKCESRLCEVQVNDEKGGFEWRPALQRRQGGSIVLFYERDGLKYDSLIAHSPPGAGAGTRWTQWRFVHRIFQEIGMYIDENRWNRRLEFSNLDEVFSALDAVVKQGVSAQEIAFQAAFAMNYRLVHYLMAKHGASDARVAAETYMSQEAIKGHWRLQYEPVAPITRMLERVLTFGWREAEGGSEYWKEEWSSPFHTTTDSSRVLETFPDTDLDVLTEIVERGALVNSDACAAVLFGNKFVEKPKTLDRWAQTPEQSWHVPFLSLVLISKIKASSPTRGSGRISFRRPSFSC